jgi:hypothetical protein
MVTDNSTASGITNNTVKQKRSKAMDMQFYWIRDRVRQGQYIVYWSKGATNQGDYPSKHHHHVKTHRHHRPHYLYVPGAYDNFYDCLSGDAPAQNDTDPSTGAARKDTSLKTVRWNNQRTSAVRVS